MILTQEESSFFFRLYNNLLVFVCNRLKLCERTVSVEDFLLLPFREMYGIRNRLYERIELLDEFCEENPAGFAEHELGVVLQWKNFVADKFLFYRQYKKYCAVLYSKESVVLGVLGLTQPLDEVAPFLPNLVDAVLLPFEGKIVSDGFLTSQRVHLGGNIKRSIKREYEIAKSKYGIIRSFPIKRPSEIDSKANLLKYYLRNYEKSPDYEYKISELLEEDPSLTTVYHRELGRQYAKHCSKELRHYGFGKTHFACMDEFIVASGRDKKELQRNIDSVVPAELKENLYIFKL